MSSGGRHDWTVATRSGTVAELHAFEPSPRRAIWCLRPTDAAVVLGSAQPDVDRAAAARHGLGVVRRRSGGGAVVVAPGSIVWIDVVIPAGDERWDHDIGRAAWWLGEVWASALAGLGSVATVHRGPLDLRRWGRQICFAGIGPGEVSDPSGAKLVGVSQRRTRSSARFQTAALVAWDPEPLLELVIDPDDRDEARAGLHGGVATLAAPVAEVEERFVSALRQATRRPAERRSRRSRPCAAPARRSAPLRPTGSSGPFPADRGDARRAPTPLLTRPDAPPAASEAGGSHRAP